MASRLFVQGLAGLFQAPSALMFQGSFEEAKAKAVEEGKWLVGFCTALSMLYPLFCRHESKLTAGGLKPREDTCCSMAVIPHLTLLAVTATDQALPLSDCPGMLSQHCICHLPAVSPPRDCAIWGPFWMALPGFCEHLPTSASTCVCQHLPAPASVSICICQHLQSLQTRRQQYAVTKCSHVCGVLPDRAAQDMTALQRQDMRLHVASSP